MNLPEKLVPLVEVLPDAEAAKRFFFQLAAKHPAQTTKLLRAENSGLLHDALALAASSEFLATTLLEHPEFFEWLKRERKIAQVRTTEHLLESLARFALTNSSLEPASLLARFRRRELLRIYLRDIRDLATVAEITLDLSNLADAILEYALRIANQELENRWCAPLEIAANNKTRSAQFCIVALGKLGSRELNYASDIDLMFLYSSDNSAGAITNREFFVKLAERTAKIVGQSTAEIAAYRVDLRLRPHGRVGALAVSLAEAIRYYEKTARDWERQVLVRSRVAAGSQKLFKQFADAVESSVFRPNVNAAEALRAARESKQKIDREHKNENGFDVKLGAGGIREIEFVAQALQLAFAGKIVWLREPHTLIALNRLADRGILTQTEFSRLADAYKFLRTLEHRLQMENGLQTHRVPHEAKRRETIARRMNCRDAAEFAAALESHTANVNQIFKRVFEPPQNPQITNLESEIAIQKYNLENRAQSRNRENEISIALTKTENNRDKTDADNSGAQTDAAVKSDKSAVLTLDEKDSARRFRQVSSYFAEILNLNPKLAAAISVDNQSRGATDYAAVFKREIERAATFAEELTVLRENWNRFYIEIAALDALEKIEMHESCRRQTALAEASLNIALQVVQNELKRRFDQFTIDDSRFTISVLGLGKLGSRGMDYGSDLDLVLIYDDDDAESPIAHLSRREFYSRAAEILVAALSSLTRDGQLYRVDLRLRPDGKNGAAATGKTAFLQYVETRSAIWEWLAYVKLRFAAGDSALGQNAELAARKTIHERARQIDQNDLKTETRRVRDLLEQQKTKNLRRGEIDIKYQAGGLLDVYFVVRYLQLRDSIADENADRSTARTLEKLFEVNSLDLESFEILRGSYQFLRRLDHASRLVAGRASRLSGNPNSSVLTQIQKYLKIAAAPELLSELVVHTTNIRTIYKRLLS